jgi:MTH538 TIR-like domain (DUF1863)
VDQVTNSSATTGAAAPPHYWAFISYSRHDEGWAKRLHGFLETYRIPRELVGRTVHGRVIPRRLLPIFRDRDEFAGGSDLGVRIGDALAASRSLVVICSPYAAASKWVDREIARFKTIGKSDHIFPLIVAGEPFASENPDANLPECFPKSLRFTLDANGAVTTARSEPLAADAREGMDGWKNACLKLIAGILGVRFDELRQRERARQRRLKLMRAALAALAAVLVGASYVGLADADLAIPQGEEIRRDLDHYGLSLLRPVPAAADLSRAAVNARAPLRRKLLAYAGSGKPERVGAADAWTTGQVLAALVRDHGATADDLKTILPLLRAAFRSAASGADARNLLIAEDSAGNAGRAEPVIWMMMALAGAIGRATDLPPDAAAALAGLLAATQSVAEAFYPLEDGGWNVGAKQTDLGGHFIYTSALALQMLLQTRSAGQPWLGSKDKLDRMIADTSRWLVRSFVPDVGQRGWRRTVDDDKAPDAAITLTVYSALGRACAEAGFELPPMVQGAALEFQSGLRRRTYDALDPDVRHDFRILGPDGQDQLRTTITRVIWYPWAVQGLASWRQCARQNGLPLETLATLDRSLGHLLADLSPQMIADVTRTEAPIFLLGETDYGLGAVD